MKIGSHGNTDNPRRVVRHTIELIADIPCDRPEAHKSYHKEKSGCLVCKDFWYRSLPWVRSFSSRHLDDDSGLLRFLNLPKDIRNENARYSRVIKDFWIEYGKEWEGYTCEHFGVELGEVDDPDSSPYLRIPIEDKPNLFIRLFRIRVCYEPQKVDCPLFLEVKLTGVRDYEISIKGLDADLDISTADVKYLMRAREFLLNIDPEPLWGLQTKELITKLDGFKKAARQLGEEKIDFSKLNLCNWYGGRGEGKEAKYKTRKPYYEFLKQVRAEAGDKAVKSIKELLEREYKEASAILTPKKQPVKSLDDEG
ncbi:MAG TPA: hypothetical protein VE262_02365 [Blastocatellia bacterium]|nr:hypothetical protein [Blastocatellia bacterium]